jgi:hypothetical protein
MRGRESEEGRGGESGEKRENGGRVRRMEGSRKWEMVDGEGKMEG